MRRCPCACVWGTGTIVGSWCRVQARGGRRLRSVGLVGGQLVRRRLCLMHPCFLRVLHKAWHVVGVCEASVSVECAKEWMHMSPAQRSTPEGRNHLPPLCFPALRAHTHTHTEFIIRRGVQSQALWCQRWTRQQGFRGFHTKCGSPQAPHALRVPSPLD